MKKPKIMFGKHKFTKGQRVRPSRYGIDRLIFASTYRGEKRSAWSGVVVSVDRFNTPRVKWDALKTARSYFAEFIEPDRRAKRKPKSRKRISSPLAPAYRKGKRSKRKGI